jgi:hypothetical protein
MIDYPMYARVVSILPQRVVDAVADHDRFSHDVARYGRMSDADPLLAVEVCLKNLTRIDQDYLINPDFRLRAVIVPELCERVSPGLGLRKMLRRYTTSGAEYAPSGANPFRLSADRLRKLEIDAGDLRDAVAEAAAADDAALVEQARFAIAGSRGMERWSPSECVYESGFVYRIVPVLAIRVLGRGETGTRLSQSRS